MDAVSYPNPNVIAFFEKHLVPVRVLSTSQPLPQQFKVQWTPTLVLLDAMGEEHYRTVGFLSPEELIPSLLLGIAKSHFDRGQYSLAAKLLEQLLAEYPKSAAAPEATYYLGVARYKDTHNPGALKQAAEALQAHYFESEWAKRASVYQLL
jgi:tetratricopeptide (TPR) repeat protein